MKLSASRFASYQPLVFAMLVCHKWHVIASQAALLWTDIDFKHQGSFAPVLLTRSLGAPIRLCGRLDKDNVLLTVITDNGARISELDLCVGTKVSHPTSVLQSILAVDMPQVRVLSLFRGRYNGEAGLKLVADANAPAPPFPALKVMLLEGFLFVPAHSLLQLTHLHLAWLDGVDPSSILDLLRSTPALEVLDIIKSHEYTGPQNLPTRRWTSVNLPRLHSVYMWSLATITVHQLMTRLEVPNLASLRLSSISAKSGTLLSTPLVPGSLAARTVNRLAFDVVGNFTAFYAALYGADLSLSMNVTAHTVSDPAERASWALDDFPALFEFPLAGVDELHFQTQLWPGVGEPILLRLAAHTPALSTLVIRHNQGYEDTLTDGLMSLARAIAALLANKALVPRLAHLELIVGDIPHGFCDLLVPGLAQRDLDGRRVRRLCVRVNDALLARWSMKWMGQAKPDYREASIREHVDFVSIGETKKRGHTGHGEAGEEPTDTLGWGQWKGCVQPARHDYWRE